VERERGRRESEREREGGREGRKGGREEGGREKKRGREREREQRRGERENERKRGGATERERVCVCGWGGGEPYRWRDQACADGLLAVQEDDESHLQQVGVA
jgi:hypothetical protein